MTHEREREHKGAVSLGEKHGNKLESSMGLENFETEENFEPIGEQHLPWTPAVINLVDKRD